MGCSAGPVSSAARETNDLTTYTYDEAREASIDYFGSDELAGNVFCSKYALRNDNDDLVEKTPADMHRRLAREFARIEANYPNPMSEDEIFELFDHFKRIVPQGSPMSAVGNPAQIQSLSNCFVIQAPADSYGSIARADEEVLQIQKRRGGVGLDLSNIRPRDLPVRNAARTSDGVGIFMERYSNTTREVAQGGRRGALMETIDVRHPDVGTFITIKSEKDERGEPVKVTGANVSVRVTDDFMGAVESSGTFALRWPVDSDTPTVGSTVPARDLWNQMMFAAWDSGEPGVLFWDTVLRESMADVFADKGFKTVCTNPCSELPLSAYDSCRLLLVNVLTYVKYPFTAKAKFDFKAFGQDVEKAQRLMDDLVDLEIEAVDRIIAKVQSDPEAEHERERELDLWRKVRKACSQGRRTGTGLTAVGDAVAALGLRYGSPESIEVVEAIYKGLAVHAHASSVQMARERGSFPAWEPGRYADNPFAQRLREACDKETNSSFEFFGRRNIALTTTAPAGTVSMMTQTTSGIEPVYQLTYNRWKKLTEDDIKNGAQVDRTDALGDKWQKYVVFHHGLQRWMDATGETDVQKSPYWGASSNDVDWLASVDLLAAAQKWTEHSISKTINLPKTATVELVSQVYMRAWKAGIKGVTVYRDGSRAGVLTSTETQEGRAKAITDNHAPTRPKELECDVHRVTIKGEQYLVLVGLMDNRPYEVFAGLAALVEVPKKAKKATLIKNGKKDGIATYNLRIPLGDDDVLTLKDVVCLFDNPEHGALTRMLSLALRHGVPVQFVVEQCRKDKHSDLQSFSTVVARVLKGYIKDGTGATTAEKSCASCGSTDLQYLQGCITCAACGSSKCS